MSKRTFGFMLKAVLVVTAVFAFCFTAAAQTRLFVPQFRFSDTEDTQFLIANQNDRDVTVDLWAFTTDGELLGQFQLPVKANGTRALTLGEALQLEGKTVTGWIGAVSNEPGIQLSYSRVGDRTESFEAQNWTSKEVSLALSDSGKDVVRVSNPNSFATNLTLRGTDRSGQFVGIQELSVGPFGQIELPASEVLRGRAARILVESNGDVIAGLDDLRAGSTGTRIRQSDAAEDYLALVIDSKHAIGAYQVTLTFDPDAVQFSSKDVESGLAEGFESKPLVVNIDNVAGQMTLGSFQVGANPEGRNVVARLRVARRNGASTRFGIKIDEITDTTGRSLSGADLSVGMVRTSK